MHPNNVALGYDVEKIGAGCLIFEKYRLYSMCLSCFQDAYPKGEVFIGSKDRGFSVMSGIASVNAKDPGFGFTVKTPERHYHFSADSKQDRHEWIAVINHVVEQPMSPQDSKILYRSSSL